MWSKLNIFRNNYKISSINNYNSKKVIDKLIELLKSEKSEVIEQGYDFIVINYKKDEQTDYYYTFKVEGDKK